MIDLCIKCCNIIYVCNFGFLVALNALRNLCTSTEILSDPNNLPEEIKNIIQKNQTNNQPPGNRH